MTPRPLIIFLVQLQYFLSLWPSNLGYQRMQVVLSISKIMKCGSIGPIHTKHVGDVTYLKWDGDCLGFKSIRLESHSSQDKLYLRKPERWHILECALSKKNITHAHNFPVLPTIFQNINYDVLENCGQYWKIVGMGNIFLLSALSRYELSSLWSGWSKLLGWLG